MLPETAHGTPLPLSLMIAEVRGGYCASDRPVKSRTAFPANRMGRLAISMRGRPGQQGAYAGSGKARASSTDPSTNSFGLRAVRIAADPKHSR